MSENLGHSPTEALTFKSNKDKEIPSLDFQIEQIVNLPNDPEAISDYIRQRKESLGKNPIRTLEKFNSFFQPITGGFFDNEMKIEPGNAGGATFSLDDDKIFEALIGIIRRQGESAKTEFGGNNHLFVLKAIQYAVATYFENVRPSAQDRAIRKKKFDFSDEENHYSISDHKQGALCAERAAVAHDLLMFCGDDSMFVSGYLSEELEDVNNEELHAYLLTKNKNGEYEVFDPTNPTLVYADADFKKLDSIQPFVINTNSTEMPKRGQSYESQAEHLYFENGEKKSKPIGKKTYTIGPRTKQ